MVHSTFIYHLLLKSASPFPNAYQNQENQNLMIHCILSRLTFKVLSFPSQHSLELSAFFPWIRENKERENKNKNKMKKKKKRYEDPPN